MLEASRQDLLLPKTRLWTRAEYDRAAELGLFRPDERLELLEGHIVEKVTPQKTPHATAIRAAQIALDAVFGQTYDVRCQLPMALDDLNEPEPDICVAVGSFRDYEGHHPTTAVLVVEIADSSLATDRTTKAAVYARAGITEYWIVNLQDRILEVHREPAAMPEQPLGHHYRSIMRLGADAVVSPLAAPAASIHVSDLLPRA